MCSCSLMIHHNINQLKYAIPSKSICFSHMLTTLSIHLFVFTYSTHTLSEKKKKKEKGKKKKEKKKIAAREFRVWSPTTLLGLALSSLTTVDRTGNGAFC